MSSSGRCVQSSSREGGRYRTARCAASRMLFLRNGYNNHKRMLSEGFSLAAGFAGLAKNCVWGSDFETEACIGAAAWLSSTTRWGCGYRCDGIAVDSTVQRYYAASYGRFNTVDPMAASANPKNPLSWNRYTYGGSDPVNRFDPAAWWMNSATRAPSGPVREQKRLRAKSWWLIAMRLFCRRRRHRTQAVRLVG